MTNTYDRIWMLMPGPSSGVPNEGRRDPDATPVSATIAWAVVAGQRAHDRFL